MKNDNSYKRKLLVLMNELRKVGVEADFCKKPLLLNDWNTVNRGVLNNES